MTLKRHFIKNKNSLIYRGIGLITFGLLNLCYPGEEIIALAFPFGMLLLIAGLFNIIRYISYSKNNTSSLFLLGKGVAELSIGFISLFSHILQVNFLWELIAFWVIMTGAFQIFTFSKIKQIVKEWKLMVVLGNLAVIFGTFLLVNSTLNLIDPTYELAIFAIFYGSCFIYVYLKIKEKRKYLREKLVEI